jgi:hypothetical protein
MTNDITISGVEETIRALDAVISGYARKSRAAVALAGLAAKADIQALAPYKRGDYRRSIHCERVKGSDFNPYVEVGTNKIQAKQLEYGGIIRAKNAPYLVFQTYDGAWHSVKSVYQRPKPHFRPVLDLNGPKYMEMIREYMAR